MTTIHNYHKNIIPQKGENTMTIIDFNSYQGKPVISQSMADFLDKKIRSLDTSEEKARAFEKIVLLSSTADSSLTLDGQYAEVYQAIAQGTWTVDNGLFVIRVPEELGLGEELYIRLVDEATGKVAFVGADEVTKFDEYTAKSLKAIYQNSDNYIKDYIWEQMQADKQTVELTPTEEPTAEPTEEEVVADPTAEEHDTPTAEPTEEKQGEGKPFDIAEFIEKPEETDPANARFSFPTADGNSGQDDTTTAMDIVKSTILASREADKKEDKNVEEEQSTEQPTEEVTEEPTEKPKKKFFGSWKS